MWPRPLALQALMIKRVEHSRKLYSALLGEKNFTKCDPGPPALQTLMIKWDTPSLSTTTSVKCGLSPLL